MSQLPPQLFEHLDTVRKWCHQHVTFTASDYGIFRSPPNSQSTAAGCAVQQVTTLSVAPCANEEHTYWQFRSRRRALHPTDRCKQSSTEHHGAQHALWQFRQAVENFEATREVLHQFQYSMTVKHLCNQNYDVAEIHASSPDVYFVHSAAPFLPPQEAIAREAYAAMLDRRPHAAEQVKSHCKYSL